VENFFGAKGQEQEYGRKRARFFKAVAEPHHFFSPLFFAAKQRENEKEKPRLAGLFC
jgi:hypothetical protein